MKNGNADEGLMKDALGKDGSMTVEDLPDNIGKYEKQIPKEQYGKLNDQQIKSMDWNKSTSSGRTDTVTSPSRNSR